MTLEQRIVNNLKRPLNPARVRTFTDGPSKGVPYLASHDIIRTANAVFGIGSWGFELQGQPWMVEMSTTKGGTAQEVWAAIGTLTVEGGQSVSEIGTNTRSGDGASGLEMAIKGAVSDALKRCLRCYGDQFGLVLYDKSIGEEALKERWAAYVAEQKGQPAAPVAPSTAHDAQSERPPVTNLAAIEATHAAVKATFANPSDDAPVTMSEVDAAFKAEQKSSSFAAAYMNGDGTPARFTQQHLDAWQSAHPGETAVDLAAQSIGWMALEASSPATRQLCEKWLREQQGEAA